MAWLGSIFFGYIIFVFRSVERPIVCTMLYETKRRIILQNSWVYLKGTNALCAKIVPFHNKMLIAKLMKREGKLRLRKDRKMVRHMKWVKGCWTNRDFATYETNSWLVWLCFWNGNGYPWNAGIGICELTNEPDIILLVETWEYETQRIERLDNYHLYSFI